jgi:hypothetical protein
MKQRIAQIRTWDGSYMVHHVFEAEQDSKWIDDPNGNKVPDWPPTPDGPVLLINVTGCDPAINEGDGYDPDTHECKAMPVGEWIEEEREWKVTTRPASDVTGISS